MGCTSSELVSWLPRALPDAELATDVTGQRNVAIWIDGSMELRWNILLSRRIGSLEIPQLQVTFAYKDLHDEARYRIQKCFDLQTHRGGG